MILLTCNLKKNEFIYKTEKTKLQKTNLWLPWKELKAGIYWEFEIDV